MLEWKWGLLFWFIVIASNKYISIWNCENFVPYPGCPGKHNFIVKQDSIRVALVGGMPSCFVKFLHIFMLTRGTIQHIYFKSFKYGHLVTLNSIHIWILDNLTEYRFTHLQKTRVILQKRGSWALMLCWYDGLIHNNLDITPPVTTLSRIQRSFFLDPKLLSKNICVAR